MGPRTWRGRALAAGLIALLATAPGCRSLTADPEDWTEEEALDKLRGHYPVIIEVTDQSITVPDWVTGKRRATREIRYADINRVYLAPQGKWFALWIITFGIGGPLWYDLVVEMKDGVTVPVIFDCWWGLNILPVWLYPTMLVHGYGAGYAVDFLRQKAQGGAGEGARPEGR